MSEGVAGREAPKRRAAMSEATAGRTAPKRMAGRYRWLAFSAALAAAMMDLLDTTIVSTAAPAIRVDLGGSFADVQWMAAGYTLAMAVMLLVGGRLGDL